MKVISAAVQVANNSKPYGEKFATIPGSEPNNIGRGLSQPNLTSFVLPEDLLPIPPVLPITPTNQNIVGKQYRRKVILDCENMGVLIRMNPDYVTYAVIGVVSFLITHAANVPAHGRLVDCSINPQDPNNPPANHAELIDEVVTYIATTYEPPSLNSSMFQMMCNCSGNNVICPSCRQYADQENIYREVVEDICFNTYFPFREIDVSKINPAAMRISMFGPTSMMMEYD